MTIHLDSLYGFSPGGGYLILISMFVLKVIRALRGHGVEPVLVEGYAVALRGAVRGTVDVDLAIALEEESLCKAEQALASIGLAPRLPFSAKELARKREQWMRERNLLAWSFVNPDNPLEMVDLVLTHDAREMGIVEKRMGELSLSVASLETLIEMKRASGRPQDLEDVRVLEKLR